MPTRRARCGSRASDGGRARRRGRTRLAARSPSLASRRDPERRARRDEERSGVDPVREAARTPRRAPTEHRANRPAEVLDAPQHPVRLGGDHHRRRGWDARVDRGPGNPVATPADYCQADDAGGARERTVGRRKRRRAGRRRRSSARAGADRRAGPGAGRRRCREESTTSTPPTHSPEPVASCGTSIVEGDGREHVPKLDPRVARKSSRNAGEPERRKLRVVGAHRSPPDADHCCA